MIERSLAVISNQNRRGSLALRNDLRNSFRVERILEKNSLSIKSKLVEERGRTLKALAIRSKVQEKDKRGGGAGRTLHSPADTLRCDTMVRETLRIRYEYDTITAWYDSIR